MTGRTKLINRRYRLERRTTLSDTTQSWLGFDNVLHRAVAVTMPRQELLRNTAFLSEFLQRSQIATALHHRGIVAAFDSGDDGEMPYLVTEYLGGEQLTDIIRAEAPFDSDDVAVLIEQVAGALDYAHQRGFVHGTLTAADVVVDSQGVAKVVGLGIPAGSSHWRGDRTSPQTLSFDDDVQALAAIAFEMLTGEPPDLLDPVSADDAYQIAPDVPRNASDIVAIGLGASAARFSSAGSFARAFRDFRNFDPGDFAIPIEPLIENGAAATTPSAPVPPALPFSEQEWWADESGSSASALHTGTQDTSRSIRLALVGALLLALLASVVVWRSSDVAASTSTIIPAQIEALARAAGF